MSFVYVRQLHLSADLERPSENVSIVRQKLESNETVTFSIYWAMVVALLN